MCVWWGGGGSWTLIVAEIFLALLTFSGLDCNYLLIFVPNTYSGQMTEHEILVDIYCSVHRNILWNNQQMSQYAVKFYFSASPLYVFRAAHTPIIRSTILTVSTAIDTIHTVRNKICMYELYQWLLIQLRLYS